VRRRQPRALSPIITSLAFLALPLVISCRICLRETRDPGVIQSAILLYRLRPRRCVPGSLLSRPPAYPSHSDVFISLSSAATPQPLPKVLPLRPAPCTCSMVVRIRQKGEPFPPVNPFANNPPPNLQHRLTLTFGAGADSTSPPCIFLPSTCLCLSCLSHHLHHSCARLSSIHKQPTIDCRR
jgi:hypothetical protein